MGAWLLSLDSNQPSPVNSRPPSPRWLDRKDWWRNRESNSARRSCKDHLQPAAFPVVLSPGFEPGSLRLRRRRFHQISLLSGLERPEEIEPSPSRRRRDDLPLNLWPRGGEWTELNLMPQRDCVYSAAVAPAHPYWHSLQDSSKAEERLAALAGFEPASSAFEARRSSSELQGRHSAQYPNRSRPASFRDASSADSSLRRQQLLMCRRGRPPYRSRSVLARGSNPGRPLRRRLLCH